MAPVVAAVAAGATAGAIAGAACTFLLLACPKRRRGARGSGGCRAALRGLRLEGVEGAQARPRVVLIGTGSVASVKIPELVVLLDAFADVVVVLSAASACMLGEPAKRYAPAAYSALEALRRQGRVRVLVDADEWDGYASVGSDPVVHVELAKWADCIAIAPCSAHTLAKMALGFSDNLATCILRARSPDVPVLVAPAMNTVMWEHPATALHLSTLCAWRCTILPPEEKRLACGDIGRGALAPPARICAAVRAALAAAAKASAAQGSAGEVARLGAWQRCGFSEWELPADATLEHL